MRVAPKLEAVRTFRGRNPDEEPDRRLRRRLHRGLGLAFLLIAIVFLYFSIGLDAGTADRPGPAVFPRLVGFGLFISALVVIFEPVPTSEVSDRGPEGGEGRMRVLVLASSVVGYIALLDVLGFLLTTALVLPAVSWSLQKKEKRSYRRAILVGVVIAVAVDAVFGLLLEVVLPDGLLDFGLRALLG
jgi:putative tricarboxylic transport membrane protein